MNGKSKLNTLLGKKGVGFPPPPIAYSVSDTKMALMVYRRLIRSIRPGSIPAYLLGRHAEEITLVLPYIEVLVTELIDNR